jgi:hypothetical protein
MSTVGPIVDRELLIPDNDRQAINIMAQPLISRGLPTTGYTETLAARDVIYLDPLATPPNSAYRDYIQTPLDALKYKSTYNVDRDGARELVETSIVISKLGGIGVAHLVKLSGAYTITHSAPLPHSGLQAGIPEELSEDEAISILEDIYLQGSRDASFLFHNGIDDLISKLENLSTSVTIERQAMLYDLSSQTHSPLHVELYEQLYSHIEHDDPTTVSRKVDVVARMFKLHAVRPLLSGTTSSTYRFLTIGQEPYVKLSTEIHCDEVTDEQKAAYYAEFIAANQEENTGTFVTILSDGLQKVVEPDSNMVRLG